MSIKRYDLTEDCTTGKVDITPVPETMEGRYVSYEDYNKLQSQLTALTSQLESVVAENAALKDDYKTTPALRRMGWPKTPATDAFLAEVRASGVEMFAEVTIKIGEEEDDEDIVYAGRQAVLFAAQLRKGVQS